MTTDEEQCAAERDDHPERLRRLRELAEKAVVLAARSLVRSQYDGPFMGDDVVPLFAAVRVLESFDAEIAELDK